MSKKLNLGTEDSPVNATVENSNAMFEEIKGVLSQEATAQTASDVIAYADMICFTMQENVDTLRWETERLGFNYSGGYPLRRLRLIKECADRTEQYLQRQIKTYRMISTATEKYLKEAEDE